MVLEKKQSITNARIETLDRPAHKKLLRLHYLRTPHPPSTFHIHSNGLIISH
jgi:hypothetical protein